jgi:hypothetical protein
VNASRVRALLAVLAVIVGGGVTVAVVDNGPDHEPGQPRRTITVAIGKPGHQRKVALPPAAQATAKSQAREDAAGAEQAAHSDLHDTRPPAPAIAKANAALTPPGAPSIPKHVPLAAPNVPGCRTLLVRNYSSRNGAPVLVFIFHFTVSRDSGWAGVLGNVKWFDTAAASASSTYVADRLRGACALTVPETAKAWAQAAYNPWALSLEVTATGREGSYLPPGPGRQKVLYLMHRAHRIYKIPYQHCRVGGGRILRRGFCQHKDLGQLGGGHFDVAPYSIDPLIAEARRTDPSAPKPVTVADRATCRRLTWWRTHGRPHGKPERNAIRRRHALERRGVTCTNGTTSRRR